MGEPTEVLPFSYVKLSWMADISARSAVSGSAAAESRPVRSMKALSSAEGIVSGVGCVKSQSANGSDAARNAPHASAPSDSGAASNGRTTTIECAVTVNPSCSRWMFRTCFVLPKASGSGLCGVGGSVVRSNRSSCCPSSFCGRRHTDMTQLRTGVSYR